jgi:hypothetical protein
MDQKILTEQLQKLFSTHQTPKMSSGKMKMAKEQFLMQIAELQEEQMNTLVVSKLKKFYKGYNEVQKSNVQRYVLQTIRQEEMIRPVDAFLSNFLTFGRKGVAMAFAFLLVFTTFLGPFQTLQPLRMVTLAQAAFLECDGDVYLNGLLCSTEELIQVNPGDEITTGTESLATLFYSDYTVVRLNDSSKATLDLNDRSQIHLSEGNVWLHSPGDIGQGSFKVDTSVLRAKVPQGAAGVSTRGAMTQLYTTTSAVEVQIQNAPGTTELMTIAPENQLLIRKAKSKARIQQSSVSGKIPEWVKSNQLKDVEYLEVVKQKTLENTMAGAGVLPGTYKDALSKITQNARTVLTWDQQVRLQRQLLELDELFSEALVLFQKGDITTAEATFKAYQQKFVSLVAHKSDTIRFEISDAETDSFEELLRYHARVMSPFSPEDTEYILKQSIEQLAFTLLKTNSADTMRLVADAATNKLLLAHQSFNQGKVDLAEEILLETSEFVSQVLPFAPITIDASDLSLLNTLSSKSDQLSFLVRDIKRLKVDQLRSLTPQNQSPSVLGNNVVGTAYKPLDTDTTAQDATVKVVGQAVKEDETL